MSFAKKVPCDIVFFWKYVFIYISGKCANKNYGKVKVINTYDISQTNLYSTLQFTLNTVIQCSAVHDSQLYISWCVCTNDSNTLYS